jgi:hypothetical protein
MVGKNKSIRQSLARTTRWHPTRFPILEPNGSTVLIKKEHPLTGLQAVPSTPYPQISSVVIFLQLKGKFVD